MTTKEVTDAQRLTTLKHLAAGKGLDIVATMTHLPRAVVLDIGSKHGYPDRDKLAWAADVVEKKITEAETTLPGPRPTPPGRPVIDGPQPSRPATSTPAGREPLTKPDEIRVLLNTAKAHPSKRIQNAADRVFDQLGKLRELIEEDERKHAEKRKAEAAKARLKAEKDRLEKELADIKAKLRGGTPSRSRPAAATGDGPTSADMRAWAEEAGVECPPVGRVPRRVREAYEDAHRQAS